MNNIFLKPLNDSNIDDVFNIYLSNPNYFKLDPPSPTRERVHIDMHIKPNGINDVDKHFLGIYLGNKIIGIIDLITNYPAKHTVFIGLLMIHSRYQNNGLGFKTINELSLSLKEKEYSQIDLAVIKENKRALNFYKRNGFKVIKELIKDKLELIYLSKKI